MENYLQGPQASTRHGKDRRPSHTFKSAQAIALLEQRIAALEGRENSSSQQNTPPKNSAAQSMDADLKSFGQMFNVLERQITELETTLHSTQDDLQAVQKRLGSYDEYQTNALTALDGFEENLHSTQNDLKSVQNRLQPYDEYQAQAQAAVDKLKGLQARLQQPAAPSEIDAGVAQLVYEHVASIREVSERLLQLEDDNELAKNRRLLTKDLAHALTQRLARGGTLDAETAAALRQALDGPHTNPETQTPDVPRQQATPATDTSDDQREARPSKRATVSRKALRATNDTPTPTKKAGKRSADEEVEVEPSAAATDSPKKRRRTGQDATPSKRASKRLSGSEPVRTPEVESALSSFMSGGLSGARSEASPDTEEVEDVDGPPELRRTTRQHKPTKQHPDMVHWKVANDRVKSIRPSASSPRKSLT